VSHRSLTDFNRLSHFHGEHNEPGQVVLFVSLISIGTRTLIGQYNTHRREPTKLSCFLFIMNKP